MLAHQSLLLFSSSPVTCQFFERFEDTMSEGLVKIAETFAKVEELMIYLSFDLFIIDARSPGVDVEQVVHYIRAHPDHTFSPILLVSGNLKKTFLRQTLQLGVTDFLPEPLEIEECQTHLEAAMRSEQKRAKMETLDASELLPKQAKAPPIKQVHRVSSELEGAAKNAYENKVCLALLQVQITGQEKEKEVLELLHKQMRHQDVLLHKSSLCFLCILPQTSSRAATLIAESVFDTLQTAGIPCAVGGSYIEPPYPSHGPNELTKSLENGAFEAAKQAIKEFASKLELSILNNPMTKKKFVDNMTDRMLDTLKREYRKKS